MSYSVKVYDTTLRKKTFNALHEQEGYRRALVLGTNTSTRLVIPRTTAPNLTEVWHPMRKYAVELQIHSDMLSTQKCYLIVPYTVPLAFMHDYRFFWKVGHYKDQKLC